MTPKVKATNVLFKDFSEQPSGKKVLIFHKEQMRGSIRCDFMHSWNNIIAFYLGDSKKMDEATLVSAFPIDLNTSWILFDEKYIEPVTTEQLAEKTSIDSKDLEALNKKYFPGEKPSPPKKQQAMMMVPIGEDEEEGDVVNNAPPPVTYGQYL